MERAAISIDRAERWRAAAARHRSLADHLLFSRAVPIGLFCILSAVHIGLPGLYMDAVNPDYWGIYLAAPPGSMPAWLLPDNVLAPDGRFPLLNSLYGGGTPGYIAWGFFELFGASVYSVRMLHAAYGALIVWFTFILVARATGSRVGAWVTSLLLAVDPSFVFAWRSQYYLQLFPMLTFLPALWLWLDAFPRGEAFRASDRKLLASGVLFGFSAWGYFIFALYCAVVLVTTVLRLRKEETRASWALFVLCGGMAIGFSPFLYAHLSIVIQTGMDGYLGSLRGLDASYGISDQLNAGLWDRLYYAVSRFVRISGGQFIANAFFGAPDAIGYGRVLAWASLIAAAVGMTSPFSAALRNPRGTAGRGSIWLVVLLSWIIPLHIAFGTALGTALWYQHYIMLLPIQYVLIVVVLISLNIPSGGVAKHAMAAALATSLAVLHLGKNAEMFADLKVSGGRALYSDAVNRLGSAMRNLPPETVVAFPQWGYWMGAAVASGGARSIAEAPDAESLVQELALRPASQLFAIVTEPDEIAETIDLLAGRLALAPIDEAHIRTREGEIAVTLTLMRRQ